ncbi:hypothetical protein SLS57_011589 [Botryosphaeria dothidea]
MFFQKFAEATNKKKRSLMSRDRLKQNLKTYLFGYPIHNSLAPLVHSTIFHNLKVPWTYELVESTDKADFQPKIRSDDCVSSAISMPQKLSWMKECNEITEEGHAIGAVNTVFIKKDAETGKKRYIGTNTDCIGVREALLQDDRNILSCSTGIYLVNRIKDEVDAVVTSFAVMPSPPKFNHVVSVEKAAQLEGPVLIVGTVPDAPPATEGEVIARNITLEFLKKKQKGIVLEMCYHPKIFTEFYTLAEGNGWKVLPGTESMIHQGIAQEVLWMERPLSDMPVEAVKAGVAEELSKMSSPKRYSRC